MKNQYKRWAIWLVICLVVGLFARTGSSYAGSDLRVQLVITDMYVTHKTYPLDKGRHRQLQVKLDNAFGSIGVKFASDDKKIASVTKKGYIEAKKKGKVKIRVTVTCSSSKKTVKKKTWVQIKVKKQSEDPTATDMPYDTNLPIIITSSSPTPTPLPEITGAMQATMIINGPEPAQFNMTILDNGNGRALYNSLPRVFYLTDRDKNTKIATEENYNSGYTRDDEYKPGTLTAGDFMLYGVDRYELIYKDHKTGFAYTRLARLQNPKGLATALGTGAVSITIIKSVLPTDTPSGSLAPGVSPGVTPPVSVTPTTAVTLAPGVSPGVTLAPGVTLSPKPSVTLAPGVTPTPSSGTTTAAPGTSTTPGSGTPTPIPAVYTGEAINVTVNGNVLQFALKEGSSAAREFYNDLKGSSVPQQITMIRDTTFGNRSYAMLTKQYTETTATSPGQWGVGELVLMGNNEINIYYKKTQNSSQAASTVLGTLYTGGIPEGRNAQDFLSNTIFNVDTVGTQFSAQ